MGSGGHILAAVTRALLGVAEVERLEAGELLARAGLTRRQLEDPDNFIPLERHVALGQVITERLGFVNGGLRSGAAIFGDPANVLGFAVRRSGDHARALQRFCRYIAITNEGVRLTCTANDAGVCLNAELVAGLAELGHPSEALFAAWVAIARVATAVRWSPTRVELEHQPRGPTIEHDGFFGCPVQFGAEATRLWIDRAALALPIASTPHPFDRVLRELGLRWLESAPSAEHGEITRLLAALDAGPLEAPLAIEPELRVQAAKLLRSGPAPAHAYEVAFLLGFSSVREVLAVAPRA